MYNPGSTIKFRRLWNFLSRLLWHRKRAKARKYPRLLQFVRLASIYVIKVPTVLLFFFAYNLSEVISNV